MSVQEAYNAWAEQYDSNENKTRDLEGLALRKALTLVPFESCLEIGCGTGKNTGWLVRKAKQVTAVDFSEEMLAKAKQKVMAAPVAFIQADIKNDWKFCQKLYDLITFSLVLEHIQELEPIMAKAAAALKPGGYLYIGELHPFKQYAGSKARFETKEGLQVVECYHHHLSDFVQSALKQNLALVYLDEHFDNNDRSTIPRILTLLFRKPENPI